MATTQQYIDQLKVDKQNLVSMLNNMGVEATNNETFTSLTPKVGKIVTDPILQDKSIEITKNGTTTITADEGYDGLGNIEVVTNTPSAEVPDTGYILSEYENGFPTKLSIKGITTIPNYAFSRYAYANNNHAGSGIIEDHLKTIEFDNSISTINMYAFYYCQNIVSVNLENVRHIGDRAFSGCTSLKTTNLDNNTNVSIGGYAFHSCSNLNIKTLLTPYISENAFSYCTGLTQLSLPNITNLAGTYSKNGIFYNCTGLKAVWIGSSVTRTSMYCFNGCTNLQKMYIDLPRETVEAMSNYQYAFMNNADKVGIIVCNDDEGFITQEEFDVIDWSTYTE